MEPHLRESIRPKRRPWTRLELSLFVFPLLLFGLSLWSQLAPQIFPRPDATLTGHRYSISSVDFSPDGSQLVSGGDNPTVGGEVFLWDTKGRRLERRLVGHTDGVSAVAFSPDGLMVASAGWDKTVKLWDAPTGQCLKTLLGHSDWIQTLAFSPDGQTLASGSSDGTVRLWNTATGAPWRVLKGFGGWVETVAFSPNGTSVATGCQDGTLKLWEVASGKIRREFVAEADTSRAIQCVTFSPDGKTLVGGGVGALVWNTQTGELLHTLSPNTSYISAASFSSDGRLLALGRYRSNYVRGDGTSSDSGDMTLWQMPDGRQLQTLGRWGRGVSVLAFSPDQKMLVSAVDGSIFYWDVTKWSTPLKAKTLTNSAQSPNGALQSRTAHRRARTGWAGDTYIGLAMHKE